MDRKQAKLISILEQIRARERLKKPKQRRAQRPAMSDAHKDGNVSIPSDHIGMGWHRHLCGGYVCRIDNVCVVMLMKASQVSGG